MSEARKFQNRAPRYTLQPTDNRYLRFAHKNEQGHTHTTQFIDISATGLAFIIDKDLAPQIFEMIKVEIPLDDGQSVAWWGKVVRVEEYAIQRWYMRGSSKAHENQVLIGVRFQDLPAGHTMAIRHAIDKKFDELYTRQSKERMKHVSVFLASQAWRIIVYAISILFMVWFFYHFTQPDDNYDAQKGAPWGERFPQLNIFGNGSDRGE